MNAALEGHQSILQWEYFPEPFGSQTKSMTEIRCHKGGHFDKYAEWVKKNNFYKDGAPTPKAFYNHIYEIELPIRKTTLGNGGFPRYEFDYECLHRHLTAL